MADIKRFDTGGIGPEPSAVAELMAVFPEAVTEKKIDFDRLKQLLGEAIDTGPERYSFTWPGKAEAIRASQVPSVGTLVPDREKSVDWDTTQNLFIEGDNLEVLKLLQKSYAGKVKMVYIDPPYNTGKEFIYPDKYGEGMKTYLQYTGQVDTEGNKFSTNPETDGRYHSKWLDMMYPRLMLARNLLKKDGVIFVSIDDHEVHNLRRIMDEIFGPENWIATLTVVMNLKGNPDNFGFSDTHEYAMVYARNKDQTTFFEYPVDEETLADNWEEDEYGLFKKADTLRRTGQDASREKRPKGWFPVFVDDESNVYVTADDKPKDLSHKVLWPKNEEGEELSWTWGKKKITEEPHNLIVTNARDGGINIYKKQRPGLGDLPTTKPKTIFYKPDYSTSTATLLLKKLLGKKLFETPKPVLFLQDLVKLVTRNDDLVLDFFAGSGTTAHATLSLNAQDNESRKFILVQLPEPTEENSEAYKAGYKDITGIAEERIRRAGTNIKEELADKIEKRVTPLDTGFRVLRLTESTFKPWDSSPDGNIQERLELAVNPIRSGASDEDVLHEILLKSGFEITVPIEKKKVAGVSVYSIQDGGMFLTLQDGLTLDFIREVAKLEPARFVALERGFGSDDLLTNAAQLLKEAGIEFRII